MKEENDLTGKIKGLYPLLASTAPVLLLYLIFGVSGRRVRSRRAVIRFM